MPNRFYTSTFVAVRDTLIRSVASLTEYAKVAQGFDKAQVELNSAIRLPDGETAPRLPARALRAGTAVVFDAQGNASTQPFLSATGVASALAASEAARDRAEAAAANAFAALNAPMWVALTPYPQGFTVWSPADGLIYRSVGPITSSIDPKFDPTNWYALAGLKTARVLGATFQGLTGALHAVESTVQANISMPDQSSPSDAFSVVIRSGRRDTVLTSAYPIMGKLEPHILNHRYGRYQFRLLSTSTGWWRTQ